MPFAGYKDFQDCVNDQTSKGRSIDAANKICGSLKAKLEGARNDQEELAGILNMAKQTGDTK
jgi:hypothetical protein